MDKSELGENDANSSNNVETEISIPDQLPPNSSSFMDASQGGAAYDSRLMMSRQGGDYDYVSHLASSGLAGMAAAAAISTSQRKSTLYSFEPVPALRKRHSTRILRKIQQLVDEFSVRVGQQVCLVVCSPKSAFKTSMESSIGSNNNNVHFKVFGASPLERVIRNLKDVIVNNLENSLQSCNFGNNTSSHIYNNAGIDVLPPLLVDGIPTPLDKMTQAQLRAFIPVMLKYSTGRTKPAWGRVVSRPPWWPDDVPWANVRSDVRTDEEKQRQSWTNALRKVVRCCYEYHGKAHYLYDYSGDTTTIQNPDTNYHHQHSTTIDVDMNISHMPQAYEFSEQIEQQSTQGHYSGRHMLINDQETVEAQLRAIQNYNMNVGTDVRMGGMRMDSQQYSDYASMAPECDSRRIKIENYSMEQGSGMAQGQNGPHPDMFKAGVHHQFLPKKEVFQGVQGELIDPSQLTKAAGRENLEGGPQ